MAKKNGTLSNQVAQDILKLVVSEEFAPGTLLPSERELQERYSVSRTVIREATQQLTARGILMQDANAGTVISSDFTAPAMEAVAGLHRRHHQCAPHPRTCDCLTRSSKRGGIANPAVEIARSVVQ